VTCAFNAAFAELVSGEYDNVAIPLACMLCVIPGGLTGEQALGVSAVAIVFL
jgi:hypothetical protein